jgi:serine/threonine-protein kinase
MVDSKDSNYGLLSDYYGSISLIMSSTNVNVNELMDKVNGFATYNEKNLANENKQKFENYLTLGKIYVTYLSSDGVPEQAETVMTQALKDIADYGGEEQADFYFSYINDLAEIYYVLGEKGDAEANYKLALNYSQEVVGQIQGKISVSAAPETESSKGYLQSYVNAMCRIAELHAKLGDMDSALDTYKKAEDEMGEGNENAIKIYSEHLNYLYTQFEEQEQDPGRWTGAQKKQILEVFDAGSKISGIESNPNWIKRSSVMSGLKDGSLGSSGEGE